MFYEQVYRNKTSLGILQVVSFVIAVFLAWQICVSRGSFAFVPPQTPANE
jgi:hypothetical protein